MADGSIVREARAHAEVHAASPRGRLVLAPAAHSVLVVDAENAGRASEGDLVHPAIRAERVTSVRRARIAMAGHAHLAWLFVVDARASEPLALLAEARRGGWHTPALITTRARATRSLVNDSQLLGAELLCAPYARAHVHAFLERALGRSRTVAPTHDTPLTDTLGLTPREREIVDLLRRGVRRVAIASELRVSENTVKSTVRALLRKTRCESVDQLRCALLRGASPEG